MTSGHAKIAVIAILTLSAAWGARLMLLEGLIYAWPRAFAGDFGAAMYDPQWWDGSGILYGPVFVIEKWAATAWPAGFPIFVFALANFGFAAVALASCLYAARPNLVLALLVVAAWLAFNRLSYALAVAANPEFIELALLSIAWAAATRKAVVIQGAATAVAAMTKLVPLIFLIPLMLLRRWRSVVAFAAISSLLMGIVGYGQKLGPVDTIIGTLLPFRSVGAGFYVLPTLHGEFLGLNTAIARTILSAGIAGDESSVTVLATAQVVSLIIIGLLVLASSWAVLALSRSALSERAVTALTYALFFALMPLVTLSAHSHTFIFLLPTFTALGGVVLVEDPDLTRRLTFGGWAVACYLYLGLPGVFLAIDRVTGSELLGRWSSAEPIWGNVALSLCLLAYVLTRLSRTSLVSTPSSISHMSAVRLRQ